MSGLSNRKIAQYKLYWDDVVNALHLDKDGCIYQMLYLDDWGHPYDAWVDSSRMGEPITTGENEHFHLLDEWEEYEVD